MTKRYCSPGAVAKTAPGPASLAPQIRRSRWWGCSPPLNQAFERVAMHGVQAVLTEQAACVGLPLHRMICWPAKQRGSMAVSGRLHRGCWPLGSATWHSGDLFLEDVRAL